MALFVTRTARLRAAFTDPLSGSFVDPTSVLLTITSPLGEVFKTGYDARTVQRASAGLYYYDLLLSVAGKWSYLWESTGTGQETNGTGTFTVVAN